MYDVEYYRDKRRKQPVSEWLDDIYKSDIKGASKIDAQIQKLSENGLKLLDTKMMEPIVGRDNHLYELKPTPYRVIVYHNVRQSRFVLLHGFRKTKRRQNNEIAHARRILDDYLSRNIRK